MGSSEWEGPVDKHGDHSVSTMLVGLCADSGSNSGTIVLEVGELQRIKLVRSAQVFFCSREISCARGLTMASLSQAIHDCPG